GLLEELRRLVELALLEADLPEREARRAHVDAGLREAQRLLGGLDELLLRAAVAQPRLGERGPDARVVGAEHGGLLELALGGAPVAAPRDREALLEEAVVGAGLDDPDDGEAEEAADDD